MSKKSILIVAAIFFVIGINEIFSEDVVLPQYTVTNDVYKRDVKRTVDVQIYERTDKETLKALATHVREHNADFTRRAYVFFYLDRGDTNTFPYAKASFEPLESVDVYINGATPEEYQAIIDAPLPEGRIVATWYSTWGIPHKRVGYQLGDKFYIQDIFSEGSGKPVELNVVKTEYGYKLQDDGGIERGEYYVINENGDLEFWSENGNYYTTKLIEAYQQ